MPLPKLTGQGRRTLALLVVLAAGCGPAGPSLSGVVTYEGKEVEKGFISLSPADGLGQTMGAPVVRGRYRLAGVSPGPKLVTLTAEPAVRVVPQSMEEAKNFKPPPVEEPNLADAVGNGERIEVAGSGAQQFDFHLTKRAR